MFQLRKKRKKEKAARGDYTQRQFPQRSALLSPAEVPAGNTKLYPQALQVQPAIS